MKSLLMFNGRVPAVSSLIAFAFFCGFEFASIAAQEDEPKLKKAPVVATNPGLVQQLSVRNQPMIARGEAYAGQPLGIGKISFRLHAGDEVVLATGAVKITEANQRIFYPVMTRSAINRLFGSISGNKDGHPDDMHTFWFLFRGTEPLNIAIHGTDVSQYVLPVEFAKPRKFERFVNRWWQQYNNVISKLADRGDYPAVVETYLQSMLARRMGLQPNVPSTSGTDPLGQTMKLLFDVESLRNDQIRRSMLGMADNQTPTLPLPPSIQWSPLYTGDLPDEIPIESIAHYIPEECYYLRFGTWQNQLWLKRLMEEYGGDLGQMISVRGYRPQLQSKFLNQLVIQSSEWDELFGGNLIDDVAVIGSDVYTAEGAAIGVLLHSINPQRLHKNLLGKREAFAKKNAGIGVSIEKITYRDQEIHFVSTPDNRYRSFYVNVKNGHLTTTSLAIARRFVDASLGDRPLALSEEFRYARYQMPLDRDDTVFIYLSTSFFKTLLTPQYQIELRRRNRVISDMQLLDVAAIAAQSEGLSSERLQTLVDNGFLPTGFGARPDQSVFAIDNGVWQDSIRGRRGFFLPIPDVEIPNVTQDESNWYRERASYFAQTMSTLDPMMVAIKRYDRGDEIERVVFDARIAPFGQKKFGWIVDRLGPPLKYEISSSPSDIISLQASLKGGGNNGQISEHQIFAAVQDYLDPDVSLQPTTALKLLQTLKEAPAYIGGWPAPGYLDWLPRLGGQPDVYGYTFSRILGLWRLQWGEFSLVSFDRDRLEQLKPHLKVIPSERAAQVRLKVRDLGTSKLVDWANALNYRRSWQTSIANTRLLHMLVQQFGMELETARLLAERMLNVELVCSQGGDYQLFQLGSGRKIWGSTAWPSFSSPELPSNYQAPILKWFRGAEVEIKKNDFQFAVHGFLDIKRQSGEPAMKLPSFDMFKGFGKLFSGDKQADQEKKEETPSGSESDDTSPERAGGSGGDGQESNDER